MRTLAQQQQCELLLFCFSIIKMSTSSRDDLHTDRSMQLDSEPDSQGENCDCIYLDKMQSHLEFMEGEFRRNMDWQKKLLAEVRKARKQPPSQRRNGSLLALQLKPREEERLREVLMDYCAVSSDRLSLSQLIKLAASLKGKAHPQQKGKDVSFPLLPRVITLNDLAPSTQRHLDSSRVSPFRLAESRVRVPKYRQAVKTPHQLFSPQLEETGKGRGDVGAKQEKRLEDSLEKRLQGVDGNNFVTFREYLADSLRNRLSENVSLNLSSSPREPSSAKESLLLISDEEEGQQNPSIYLQLQLSKEAERGEDKSKREILCFSAIKKRKIARIPPWIPKNCLLEQSKTRFKKLQDSFGKIYHEFDQGKQSHDAACHPAPNHDRETECDE